ncbi:hypothetical protein CBR_g75926 [Chara braunii]|uniref:Uncharacterized protein n=1 Tax=Chara braunii TaxID=69332 RepID=A0A388JJR4_CHABU|nr:hypothetical protein CBR_g75926 [Chara braunii]|eukprot:GBG42500.1 hypothetical protein CBR_g75926 [Chara braunii]
MAGNSGAYGGYGYDYGGGLRPHVETLEVTIAGIKAHQDAEIAKENSKREEEERIKKDKEEEERRLQEKKAREEFQAEMRNELSGKLDSVRELLESKKGDKDDEVTKMHLEIENLRKTLREGNGASSSESVFDRCKRELEEERAKSDQRLATMEDEIARLRVVNDEAVAAADVWKQVALRPGLDKVAVATVDKGKRPMSPATQAVEANDRDAFLVETRRTLRPLKKDKVVTLCEKEGVTYSTLDKAKEELALKRADVAFGKDRGGTVKKGGVLIHEVTEETEQGTTIVPRPTMTQPLRDFAPGRGVVLEFIALLCSTQIKVY